MWLSIVKKEVGEALLISETPEPGKEKRLKIKTLPKCFSRAPNQASLLLHPWGSANALNHHPFPVTDPEGDELVT